MEQALPADYCAMLSAILSDMPQSNLLTVIQQLEERLNTSATAAA
jgi:hypothetical protein